MVIVSYVGHGGFNGTTVYSCIGQSPFSQFMECCMASLGST